MKYLLSAAIVLFVALSSVAAAEPATRPAVRCAIIGGMVETGFWPALAERFQKETGNTAELVASGPKEGITRIFRQGRVDFITLHASDEIINLVADGYASDPQPWARNDMVLVGPDADPAKIRGIADPLEALRKIGDSRSAFVVHASLGAQGILRSLLDSDEDIELDPAVTTILIEDRQRLVLRIAQEKKAYTLVGRIPFRSGKIPSTGMAVMVEGDPRLRRPFVLAIANPAKLPDARVAAARALAAFLRSETTQSWIETFGRGKYDDRALFFRVDAAAAP